MSGWLEWEFVKPHGELVWLDSLTIHEPNGDQNHDEHSSDETCCEAEPDKKHH
jgi:hypothetical protein